jgi:hypothetical protein
MEDLKDDSIDLRSSMEAGFAAPSGFSSFGILLGG